MARLEGNIRSPGWNIVIILTILAAGLSLSITGAFNVILLFSANAVAFGSKWYSDVVFEDKKPRKLNDIFPQQEARKIIMGIM